MLRLLIALFLGSLTICTQAADHKMLYVEYRLQGARIGPASFDAQPKKVWRIGTNYLRFEDAPNATTNVHGLIIVAEPDIWVVDRNTNQARHTVDPGPNYAVHFPTFASETSAKLRGLEFGREREYFRDHGAKELAAVAIDGVNVRPLHLQIDDREVTLYLKADGTPFQIALKSADHEYAMRFLRYEPERKPDMSLFRLPLGVQLVK